MSDVVVVVPSDQVVVTPLDHAVAFLKKLGSYLADVRTAAMIVTILMGLRVIGAVEAEIDEVKVNATLHVITEVVLALANLLTVLGPVWKYVDSVTKRPSRGLEPWLKEVKENKVVAIAEEKVRIAEEQAQG